MRKRAILLALLIAASLAATSEAGGRKQLWNIDLFKLIGQTGGSEGEHVWGLAFSPDETQLAVGFGHAGDAGGGHVIVVAVDHPKTVVHRFDIDYPADSISWSPSGKLLAVDPRVLSIEDERACQIASDFRFGGFLADDRIVFFEEGIRGKSGVQEPTEIQARRADCSVEDAWHMADGAQVAGTCPEAGLIDVWAVPDLQDAQTAETRLVS